jgi:hypothetical protein
MIVSNAEVHREMGISKSKQQRRKTERAGNVNPEISRLQWQRKPQTQVVANKKAEQRRTHCRHKGSRDGADFYRSTILDSVPLPSHSRRRYAS